MIDVEPLSADELLVTAQGTTMTEYRVRVSRTHPFSPFDLPVIGRYFLEHEKEIRRYMVSGYRERAADQFRCGRVCQRMKSTIFTSVTFAEGYCSVNRCTRYRPCTDSRNASISPPSSEYT